MVSVTVKSGQRTVQVPITPLSNGVKISTRRFGGRQSTELIERDDERPAEQDRSNRPLPQIRFDAIIRCIHPVGSSHGERSRCSVEERAGPLGAKADRRRRARRIDDLHRLHR